MRGGKKTEKLERKRQIFAGRTALALGVSESAVAALLSQERQQGIRLNPLVAPPEKTLAGLAAAGWRGSPYAWSEHCFSMTAGAAAVRDCSLVAGGAAYIQNAASWLPVVILDPHPGERILDMCAAPGGKTSHIAAITNNKALLWVNDNSRARHARMRANFTRLGVKPERMTLFDATRLARHLDGEQFDKILLDAPCSGEGLMRYDRDKDFTTWSVAHIKRLQTLQKQLITQAWQLLAPGGTLIYSTCTMAPEENEAVVDYVLRTREGAALQPITLEIPNRCPAVAAWNTKTYDPATRGCLRLAPSPDIEAFFVASLTKLVPGEHAVL